MNSGNRKKRLLSFLTLGTISVSSAANAEEIHAFCKRLRIEQQTVLATGNFLLSQHLLNVLAALSCHTENSTKLDFERAAHAYKLGDEFLYQEYVRRRIQDSATKENALLFDSIMYRSFVDSTPNPTPVSEKPEVVLWQMRHSGIDPVLATKLPPQFSQATTQYIHLQNTQKSPTMASILNLVMPGAGYAYANAWQSAFLSFAINSALLLSTSELWRANLKAPAALSGALFSVTYIGSAMGSHKAVSDANKSARVQIDKEYLSQFPQFGFSLGTFL